MGAQASCGWFLSKGIVLILKSPYSTFWMPLFKFWLKAWSPEGGTWDFK